MDLLANEFQAILKKYGHYVLLVHSDQQQRCSCWTPTSQSANRTCPYCFGLGYVPVIEKHLVRSQTTTSTAQVATLPVNQRFGQLIVPSEAYFFDPRVVVAAQDLIVEVEWQGDLPVYRNKGVFEVANVDHQRFENGEIIFNKVYVKDQPIQKRIRGITIVESAGKITYQLAEGEGI